jgi:glycosyltransferase involved in cell wall biosynthesis
MRIAFLTPEYPGCGPSFGVGQYVSQLARHFSQHGHAVLVLVVAQSGCWMGNHDHLHCVRTWRVPGFLRPALSRSWVIKTLDELAPDVVEIPNWGGLGAFLPNQWPLVTRLSTSISLMPLHNRWSRFFRRQHEKLEIASVQRADVVIANSQTIDAQCAPFYRRAADVIIPHAYGGPVATQNHGKDALFVGRLESRKGIDILLRGWQLFQQATTQLHEQPILHIVGLDRYGMMKKLPPDLSHSVHYHGPLSDRELAKMRHNIGLQIIPSRFESFGLTALEAFAHGHGVIAADCAGLQETIADAGLFYARENPHALAQTLHRWYSDLTQWNALRAAGKTRLETRFAFSLCAEHSIQSYELARARHRLRLQGK